MEKQVFRAPKFNRIYAIFAILLIPFMFMVGLLNRNFRFLWFALGYTVLMLAPIIGILRFQITVNADQITRRMLWRPHALSRAQVSQIEWRRQMMGAPALLIYGDLHKKRPDFIVQPHALDAADFNRLCDTLARFGYPSPFHQGHGIGTLGDCAAVGIIGDTDEAMQGELPLESPKGSLPWNMTRRALRRFFKGHCLRRVERGYYTAPVSLQGGFPCMMSFCFVKNQPLILGIFRCQAQYQTLDFQAEDRAFEACLIQLLGQPAKFVNPMGYTDFFWGIESVIIRYTDKHLLAPGEPPVHP